MAINIEKDQRIDCTVKIVDEYLNSLPFGNLKSRNGIAIMLSYFGEREELY